MPHFKINSFVSRLWIYFQGSGLLEDGDLSLETCRTSCRSCSWRIVRGRRVSALKGPTSSGGLGSITMNPCLKSGDPGSEARCYNTCLRLLSSAWLLLLLLLRRFGHIWLRATSPGQTSQSVKDFIKSGRVRALVGRQFLNNTSRLPAVSTKVSTVSPLGVLGKHWQGLMT